MKQNQIQFEQSQMTVEEWLDNEELPVTIWKNKYQQNNETFEQWLNRVSGNDAKVKELIREQKFIFAGRILSNRGVTDRKITYSNCYVLTPPEDNLESIFETGAKLARTFSYGGGCGLDVSKLRPKNAPVNNAAKSTSGTTSFMDFYSYITGLIGQEGRRGATMISMSCEHPDLIEFINLKSNLDICTKANISVRVTDAFMKAVENNSDFTLHFTMEDGSEIRKVINARETFMLLAKRNWEMAEPGILYWDRITEYNMLHNNDSFSYAGVNPCGEEPLPAGGSCLLGSINLSQFVLNPFETDAAIDYEELENTVRISVRALNDVLDEGQSLHPLQEQRDSVREWRQIGLGTMGLADMLIKLRVEYGSPRSLFFIQTVYRFIAKTAVEESLELAQEYGMYPKCDPEGIVESSFIKALKLPEDILNHIRQFGLRNSQLLTCAPTGSIGTMLQVSTGVELNYAFSFNRRTVSLNNEETIYKVDAKIVGEYKQATGNNSLPSQFISSQDIPYKNRIAVQSELQKYIDASISSTINLPNSCTVDEIADLYMEAWKQGLKGVTIWRDGCQREGILSTGKVEKKEGGNDGKQTSSIHPKYNSITPISRKEIGVTNGSTFCKKCACGTLYITVNRDNAGNMVEVFTHTSKGGICAANTNGLTRMVSLALRSGVSVSEIKDQLHGITCPACLKLKAQGKQIDGISCPDILSKTIGEFESYNLQIEVAKEKENDDVQEIESVADVCPECGSAIEHKSGCRSCSNCGWSKCD